MGIVGWIIDRFTAIVFSILGYLLTWFTQEIGDIFNFDLKIFKTVFPKTDALMDILAAVAIAICILIYVWQLIRCISSGISGDVDDPIMMSFKLIFVAFVIFYFPLLFETIRLFFNEIFKILKSNWMGKVSFDSWFRDGVSSFITSLNKIDSSQLAIGLADELITGSKVSIAASLPLMIIKLILFIAIGWNYIKYLIEYVERYVVWAFLTILAPLAVATAVSKQTNDIAKKFARMYVSSFLMILMGYIGLSMVNLAFFQCASATAKLGNKPVNGFLVWCLIIYSTLIVLQRIDKHFAAAGMNTAQTGGAMLDLAATAMQTFRGITRGISKTGTNFLTGYTGVKGGIVGFAASKAAAGGAKNQIASLLPQVANGNRSAVKRAEALANSIKSPVQKAQALDSIDKAKQLGLDNEQAGIKNKLGGLMNDFNNGNMTAEELRSKANPLIGKLNKEAQGNAQHALNDVIDNKINSGVEERAKSTKEMFADKAPNTKELEDFNSSQKAEIAQISSPVMRAAAQTEHASTMSELATRQVSSAAHKFSGLSGVDDKTFVSEARSLQGVAASASKYVSDDSDYSVKNINSRISTAAYERAQEKMSDPYWAGKSNASEIKEQVSYLSPLMSPEDRSLIHERMKQDQQMLDKKYSD